MHQMCDCSAVRCYFKLWHEQKSAQRSANWTSKTAKATETVGQISALSERLHESQSNSLEISAVFATHQEGLLRECLGFGD